MRTPYHSVPLVILPVITSIRVLCGVCKHLKCLFGSTAASASHFWQGRMTTAASVVMIFDFLGGRRRLLLLQVLHPLFAEQAL